MLATALAALLVTGSAPAPKATPTPPPPPPVIEGTIRGPSGVRVKDALVTVRPRNPDLTTRVEPPLTSRTDPRGRFRIVLRKSLPVDIRIEAAGLSPKKLDAVSPGKLLEIQLEAGHMIEGVVRDATSGKPIAGARVQSFTRRRASVVEPHEGLRETVTDASGRFKLDGLGAGAVIVTASASGRGRTERAGVGPGTRLELLLLNGPSILGVVRGPDGKGLGGARVQAETEHAFPLLETADSAGGFELSGLAPGTYRVWAHRSGVGTSQIEEVSLEADSGARITLRVLPGAEALGRLVTASGKPVSGVVSVLELDGVRSQLVGNVLKSASVEDGRFRVGDLPPGDHALAVQAEGFTPRRIELTIPAEAHDPLDLGEIELERGLTIQGRVLEKAGGPVAGARLHAWSEKVNMETLPEASSEPDGSFVLAGLEPGLYSVSAKASGYGGQTHSFEAGADKATLTLEPAGSITGQVVDERGSPMEAFRVFAQPQTGETDGMRWRGSKSVESSDGRFTLEDLGDGTYRVEAAAATKRPGSVKDVVVKARATTDVGRIRLEAGGSIRGVVVDTRGAPISSAALSVSNGGRRIPELQASTGIDGAFVIEGAPIGTVEVAASHPDFATGKSEPVNVDPGQGSATTRIVLSAGGRIEGHARRRGGAGIIGARVQVYPMDNSLRPHRLRAEVPVSPADGSFAVDHVPAGRIGVHLAFEAPHGAVVNRSEQVAVAEGETSTVELLLRDILVTGRVTRSGEPLAGTRVRVGYVSGNLTDGPLSAPAPPGPRRGTAVTQSDGSYELIVDQPGSTQLAVESLDYRTTYLSRMVEIPDDDSFVVDVALSGVPLSGIVIDRETGESVAHATVSATSGPKGQVGEAKASTGADGRFSLAVDPGDYRLSAEAQGYATDSIQVTVGVEGTADVRILLSHGKRIDGRVVDAGGRGASGLTVLGVFGDPSASGSSVGWATTRSDGTFSMGELLDRPYNLAAGTPLVGFGLATQVAVGSTEAVLLLAPVGGLRVTARDANGALVDGAYVGVKRVGGQSFLLSTGSRTGPDGTAELKVPQGHVEIEVGKDSAKALGAVEVPAEGVATLEIALPAH